MLYLQEHPNTNYIVQNREISSILFAILTMKSQTAIMKRTRFQGISVFVRKSMHLQHFLPELYLHITAVSLTCGCI